MYQRRTSSIAGSPSRDITDEDIYLMFCLHRYQRMTCEKIARRFGISRGKVKDLIARRANSGCCG